MYDHYIAVDWAQANMAIARMTGLSGKTNVIDVPADVKELQVYLSALRGSKILTIEETTTSQWLYTELKDHVDELIVCDPVRNRLLSDGPKTDKIDAIKLCQLLKANLLKPVFHSGDEFHYIRKVTSAYQDVVSAGIRLKSQRAALLRAAGKDKKEKELERPAEQFVLDGMDRGIEAYEYEKKRYEAEFLRMHKKYKVVRNLDSVPGIGKVGSVRVAAIVVDPRRFKSRGHFLSYSGLIRLERISGGKSYGSKNPRYNRGLKCVFKTGAMNISANAHGTSPMKNYYDKLISEKGYSEQVARHALARRIAVLAYGVLKTGKKFNPEMLKCNMN